MRVSLSDGARTTLHVASYDLADFAPRVVRLERAQQLVRWCEQHDVRHALVGGFFARPGHEPLGELRIEGRLQPSVPFVAPWHQVRACVQVDGSAVRIARRDKLSPTPRGDLLQAGPLLVCDGLRAIEDGGDEEGFSVAAHQFDSDITCGRYPRAALGICDGRVVAVACDGRTRGDAGMTLVELAQAMLSLGVSEALNLDGGGSASLVHDRRLRNRPREQHGADLLDGRPVATAIVFQAL